MKKVIEVLDEVIKMSVVIFLATLVLSATVGFFLGKFFPYEKSAMAKVESIKAQEATTETNTPPVPKAPEVKKSGMRSEIVDQKVPEKAKKLPGRMMFGLDEAKAEFNLKQSSAPVPFCKTDDAVAKEAKAEADKLEAKKEAEAKEAKEAKAKAEELEAKKVAAEETKAEEKTAKNTTRRKASPIELAPGTAYAYNNSAERMTVNLMYGKKLVALKDVEPGMVLPILFGDGLWLQVVGHRSGLRKNFESKPAQFKEESCVWMYDGDTMIKTTDASVLPPRIEKGP